MIHRVLAVRSSDPLLHHLAPIGLASAAGRCLVVDLDQFAPSYAGRSLADLVHDGPTSADLEPGSGVALLGNGGVEYEQAAQIIDRLTTVWGRVVLRAGDDAQPAPVPTLTVEPLLPPPFTPESADIIQAVTFGQVADGRPLLPPLGRHQVRTMLAGNIEPRWRWVRAWQIAWRRTWG